MTKDCDSCRHHLGGWLCRINLEKECAAGGGFEAWEGAFRSLEEAAAWGLENLEGGFRVTQDGGAYTVRRIGEENETYG